MTLTYDLDLQSSASYMCGQELHTHAKERDLVVFGSKDRMKTDGQTEVDKCGSIISEVSAFIY